MSFCGWTFSRLALIGVLAAALGLAACGRKGGLDLPPSAVGDAAAADAVLASDPRNGRGSPTTAAGARRKPLPIDVLLN